LEPASKARALADGRQEHHETEESVWRQPKAVWAVAFACVVAFMGLGLVDPILPAIARQLDATPSQVELVFTSYFLVTGVAMLITGVVSSRVGHKRTLLAGLVMIVIFSALAGSAGGISGIVGFRAGWGLGNALFIATALAVIVEVSNTGTEKAVILYEAALGLGISVGPLVGGLLGGISWRGPFYGVAVLMSIGFVAILVLLPPIPLAEHKSSILEPIRALGHRGLLTLGLTALCYNFGFFTLLAYTPLPVGPRRTRPRAGVFRLGGHAGPDLRVPRPQGSGPLRDATHHVRHAFARRARPRADGGGRLLARRAHNRGHHRRSLPRREQHFDHHRRHAVIVRWPPPLTALSGSWAAPPRLSSPASWPSRSSRAFPFTSGP